MSKENVINDLYEIIRTELSPELTYHSIEHTRDVHEVCVFYINHYELDEKKAELLEIAAVGHDVGFTKTYVNHEQVSAEITLDKMKKYGYSEEDMDVVKDLILATKIPQTPKTFLAQIICDADLDYLGREDFEAIGSQLKEEWKNFELVPNLDVDFDTIQIGFLKNHFYHTDYAADERSTVKLSNLEAIEKRLKNNEDLSQNEALSRSG